MRVAIARVHNGVPLAISKTRNLVPAIHKAIRDCSSEKECARPRLRSLRNHYDLVIEQLRRRKTVSAGRWLPRIDCGKEMTRSPIVKEGSADG